MDERSYPGLRPCQLYLPVPGTDLSKWAVVACDQFTSQPDYWARVETLVGDAPSTLRLILPEVYLREGRETAPIAGAMARYLADGTLRPAVENGFILTERTTASGTRLGLMAAVDLECYDYRRGDWLIRATEETVAERLPARVRIRQAAPLELSHVLLLIDDPQRTVIEPLRSRCDEPLYDLELMEGGGHLRGWAVTDDGRLSEALCALEQKADGFLYAVGDGNHSLAAAKLWWETLKPTLSPAEAAVHPARWALVELVNLYDEAILFRPIHRLVFGCALEELAEAFRAYAEQHGAALRPGGALRFVAEGRELGFALESEQLPVKLAQDFLDDYLAQRPELHLDYIHGEAALRRLAAQPDRVGLLLPGIDKNSLFPGIRAGGCLPRKAFSMGEAEEKRYYMECRKIR